MPRVRFDGPGRLVIFGKELRTNQVEEFTDKEAAELEAHPHLNVTVLGYKRLGSTSKRPAPKKSAAKTRATKQED